MALSCSEEATIVAVWLPDSKIFCRAPMVPHLNGVSTLLSPPLRAALPYTQRLQRVNR